MALTIKRLPSVYISKEIIQGVDVNRFSAEEKENHLSRALQKPTDKISLSKRKSSWGGFFAISGRYWEDYLLHHSWKAFNRLTAVGFTVNPEHCRDINWTRVLAGIKQENIRIIIFVRRNIVKTAISAIRGKEMKKLCGKANLSRGTHATSCLKRLSPQMNISVETFLQEMHYWQNRVDRFKQFVHEWLRLHSFQSVLIEYEHLQSNPNKVMQMMETFLSLKNPPTTSTSIQYQQIQRREHHPKSLSYQSHWIKRSPEDLGLLLSNFNAISNALLHHSCLCWLQYLHEKDIQESLKDRCQYDFTSLEKQKNHEINSNPFNNC